jgi:3-dehydroquinate dehydratase/shikimate dehydrogenase
MTRLCLTLCRSSLEDNLDDLKGSAPDLAELRIDLLESLDMESLVSFPDKAGIPLILTCRKTCDGGGWSASDTLREALLLGVLDGKYKYIDLEEDEPSQQLTQKARERGIQIIRSFHDFKRVPLDLLSRLESMSSQGDLVKAAVMPKGVADLLILFETARAWKKSHPGEDRLILLGMGDFGVPTRILAGRMGCFLSFCSPSGAEAAPGHMDWKSLHDLYRTLDVNSETQIYGIIGYPVLHTRSPQIHNPGFSALGLNAVYVPFTVDDLDAFFKLAEFLDIQGFSVTVPHKEGVRSFLVKEDSAVKAVGACNTVIRGAKGWEGFNTDVIGFIKPLKDRINLKGKNGAVIGAGGAARSAVYALMKEGCNVSVFNRTLDRALDLVRDFSCSGGSLNTLKKEIEEGTQFDLIVQTTSAGMHGGTGGENPIPFYTFSGNELVYDIIYNPPETVLMKKAKEAGCTVLGGMPMLKEQGAAQFQIFTGSPLQKSV